MDILFKNSDFVFSYRVGGILIRNDKILLQRPINDDFAIIGGHVASMETSAETLKREFEEELHAKIAVDDLLAIGEIYFPWGNRPCHQICLYYKVHLLDESIPLDGVFHGYDDLGEDKIMIILITGVSYVGKTALVQQLLEKYKYPYLSIDHLKMGLIRSGNTELTPMSDDNDLTAYLWPIVREMIKTAIENDQNLIVEGCYIPFDWEKDFDAEYLEDIRYYCLVMSENYLKNHFADIKRYASVIENRLDDEDCTLESVLEDNALVFVPLMNLKNAALMSA